jgi:hypothetical protein
MVRAAAATSQLLILVEPGGRETGDLGCLLPYMPSRHSATCWRRLDGEQPTPAPPADCAGWRAPKRPRPRTSGLCSVCGAMSRAFRPVECLTEAVGGKGAVLEAGWAALFGRPGLRRVVRSSTLTDGDVFGSILVRENDNYGQLPLAGNFLWCRGCVIGRVSPGDLV